jgi:transposase InsO family protein
MRMLRGSDDKPCVSIARGSGSTNNDKARGAGAPHLVDNAMCESFFATLKCERLDRKCFRTPAEAKMKVFDFIEGWYNPHRRHSALDYKSPMQFERSHVRAAA